MLFVSGIGSAGGAADYFGRDNYYAADHGMLDAEWAGGGAALQGLTGATPVTSENLEAMLSGNMPDGTTLSYEGRRAGYDLTFSMPKSWSLIALVGGDRRVMEAYRDSVRETMAWAEKNLAQTRLEKNGKVVTEKTGNLAYALVPHDLNRNAEPQGHVHVVLANATRGADGKWRAVDARPLYDQHTLLNAIAMTHFRAKVEALGYDTERSDRYGNFDAKGVTREHIVAFSSRRQEVLDALRERGHATGTHASDIAAKATRADKEPDVDRASLLAEWKERADSVGLNLSAIIERAQARAESQARPFDRALEGVKGAAARGAALLQAFSEWIGGQQPERDEFMPEAAWRLGRQGLANAVAVGAAIRHLSEREAAFSRFDIYKQALAFGLPTTVDGVEARVAHLVKLGVLSMGRGSSEDMVTSRRAIGDEMLVLSEAEAGRGATAPIVAREQAGARLQATATAMFGHRLNEGQEAAGRIILQSADRVLQVQGVSGAGKSSMLAPTAAVLRDEGRNVLGLGFQNKMVRDLEAGTGVGSMTIASFILKHGKLLDPDKTSPDRLAAARAMFAGAVILVDESSMVGTEQQLTLLRLANHLQIDRLVMVGDKAQLSAIAAGKPNEMMQAAGIDTAHMPENLRARTPELRAIADNLQQGRAREAIDVVKGSGSLVVAEDLDRAVAERWLATPAERRDDVGIVASGRQHRRAINALIQEGRLNAGELGAQALSLPVLEAVNTTKEELRHANTYRAGQVAEFPRGLRGAKITPGEWTVASVDHRRGEVTVYDPEKGSRRFKPEKLPNNLKDDAVRLFNERRIELRAEDKIRWGSNDRERGLLNADLARILSVDASGVRVLTSQGVEVKLAADDPMLRKVDLGYALNAHMAQGVTHKETIAVVDPSERNLATMRLTLVAATRAREGLTLVTTDADRLAAQLERNPGDKTSALEVIGDFRAPAADRDGQRRGPAAAAPSKENTPREQPVRQLPVPERQIELGL